MHLEQERDLPSALMPIWQRYQSEIIPALLKNHAALIHKTEYAETVLPVCVRSDFIANIHIQYPDMVAALFDTGEILDSRYLSRYSACLQHLLASVTDIETLKQKLRQYRRKAMFRVAWRDLAGWADLADTIADLSAFADACIREALATIKRIKKIPNADFVVIAMGKLGANELNFSSDIDLIFAYEAQTLSIEKATLLAQCLIDVLHTQTEEGFVFRVDMRLRPFGDSGALVSTTSGLLQYYRQHGRDWERYAWIKARCITGEQMTQQTLMAGMMPFVYRPYVDFGMQSAIRDMKQLVEIEVRKKQMQSHIKLGPGGIREIEFVIQALQLIHGGKYPALQTASIYGAMNILAHYQLLTQKMVAELTRAYDFLRQVEHKLQMVQDEQTHDLPMIGIDQARLAYALGYDDWPAFLEKLDAIREVVTTHFTGILAIPSAPTSGQPRSIPIQAKRRHMLRRHLLRTNDQVKTPKLYQDHVTAAALMEKLKQKGLKEIAYQRVEQLLPLLLSAAQTLSPETEAAEKMALLLLETIAFRSTYVSLLQEHPEALSNLLALMLKSQWLKQLILRYPMLLADIVQQNQWQFLETGDMRQSLHRFIDGLDVDDMERQMEAVRHFKLSMLLSVAIHELRGQEFSISIATLLTAIAEQIVAHIEQMAWHVLTQMHGQPESLFGGEHGFLIIGYGKLGGGELGYGSDLDLVFLYHSLSNHTLGKRRLGIHDFYAKLAQKVVHLLRTQTYSGALYEVDLRLRPSGNSGLLVSGIDAFSHYQLSSAWTWEHQALVRARPLIGDSALVSKFNTLRAEVLSQKRDTKKLKQEIYDMQTRLRTQHQHEQNFRNQIRYMPGGMIDLEFLSQYWMLAYAHEHPALVQRYDTLGIINACAAAGLVTIDVANKLCAIYKNYNELLRLDWLLTTPPPSEHLPDQAQYVLSLWQAHLY